MALSGSSDGTLIERDFFRGDPLTCSREMIGCRLEWGSCSGVIVETEAYSEHGDEASHTFVRKSTRAFVKENDAGTAYVYLNYGMYWMFNVLVKGRENGFVLFRALEPLRGISLMQRRRKNKELRSLCSGPGKLAQALNITGKHHGMDLCADEHFGFYRSTQSVKVDTDIRIGISKAVDLPWRFLLADNIHVSRPKNKAGSFKNKQTRP
ncbi:MAG: DNA-3-methyladenine glycosylase [Chthoniobacterales bacterium]